MSLSFVSAAKNIGLGFLSSGRKAHLLSPAHLKAAGKAGKAAAIARETANAGYAGLGTWLRVPAALGATAAVAGASGHEVAKHETWSDSITDAVSGVVTSVSDAVSGNPNASHTNPQKPKTGESELSGAGALMFGAIAGLVALLGGGAAALFEVPVTTGGVLLTALGVGIIGAAGGAVFGANAAADAQQSLAGAMKPAPTGTQKSEPEQAAAPAQQQDIEVGQLPKPSATPAGAVNPAQSVGANPGF